MDKRSVRNNLYTIIKHFEEEAKDKHLSPRTVADFMYTLMCARDVIGGDKVEDLKPPKYRVYNCSHDYEMLVTEDYDAAYKMYLETTERPEYALFQIVCEGLCAFHLRGNLDDAYWEAQERKYAQMEKEEEEWQAEHPYSPSAPWNAPGMCVSDFI